MSVEQLVEWLAGKTEVLGESLPQSQIWIELGSNPGRRGGKPATNRLSYDTASLSLRHEVQRR
jgi:hypothetical protein